MTNPVEFVRSQGAVANIGQFSPQQRRELEKAVRQGALVKYRGYWDTLSPLFGIGPLKTIYAKAA